MTKDAEQLVIVNLPLADGKNRLRALALVHRRHTHGCDLLLSDHDGSASAVWHLSANGGELPVDLEAEDLGSLSGFLAARGETVRLAMLGGAARHGRLTLARAVESLGSQPLTPQEAVQIAIGSAMACEKWLEELSGEARALVAR